MPKCEDMIMDELEATGLPYEIRPAKSHRQVRLCGRMCGILPLKQVSEDKRAALNVRSQIRRAAAKLKENRT